MNPPKLAQDIMVSRLTTLHPEMQVTIGPVIDNGFFYDFAGEHRFSPEDLEKIEQKMKELAKQKAVAAFAAKWERDYARKMKLKAKKVPRKKGAAKKA